MGQIKRYEMREWVCVGVCVCARACARACVSVRVGGCLVEREREIERDRDI